jgi:Rnl2 family RNA ligase
MEAWTKYPKISERAGSSSSAADGEWIVTEKLHGANFSVLVPPDGAIAFASRSGILAPGDNFYGYRSQGLHADIGACATALRALLLACGEAGDESAVIVYGELCGGCYPHPEVQASAGALPVQKGVWYAPRLVFVGFDVAVCAPGAPPRFLSFARAREVAFAAGLRFAEPMHVGDLASCLHMDVRFTSRLPAALGLPPLPDSPNYAEGVVVRPSREPVDGSRRLVKRKIPEFAEKQYAHEQWRAARTGGGGDGGGADAESLLRYELLAAVNPQRLASVVSKRGAVDPSDKQACRRLLDEMMEDVQASLGEEGLLDACAGDVRAGYPDTLGPELEAACRVLVTAHLRESMREERSRAEAAQRAGPAGG